MTGTVGNHVQGHPGREQAQVSFMMNTKAAESGQKAVMIVSADAEALCPVIRSVPFAPHLTVATTAGEARTAASAQHFHAIIVDLRSCDSTLALAIPQLTDLKATDNLVVIAPQPLAGTVGGQAGVSSVVVAPFSTEALLGKLNLADSPSTGISTVLRFRKPDLEPSAASDATRVLFFPDRPDGMHLPGDALAVDTDVTRPDVIVLTQAEVTGRLNAVLPRSVTAITPVIDVSGSQNAAADVAVMAPNRANIDDAFATLKPVIARARALPAEIFLSDRDDDILLARLHVRGRGIEPYRTHETRGIVATHDAHVVSDLERTAKSLASAGALKRGFFDKVNCCHECDSARVVLREECRKCRSANVEEVSVIHHFRCGYQAPERDFIEGTQLRCPKCTHMLESFSVDYDRPGSLMVCNDCGNETGEAAVGFQCLDCGTNADAAHLVAKTHHKYELTEKSLSVLVNSCKSRAAVAAPSDSPQAVIGGFIRTMEAGNRGYSAMLVRVDREGAVRREHGERAIRISLQLVSRALHEALMPDIEVVTFESSLAVLVPHGDAEGLRAAIPDLVAYARGAVALPIDIHADSISGQRLKEIVFDPAKRRAR